jgi:phospholipid/cholesterol/gamma-HCH transport system substrate-binding protein
MPRTRSLVWSELKVGVLTIAAIAITGLTIFLLTGQKGLSWQRYSLKTRFLNAAGLQSGSPVRLAGVDVGTVNDVTLVGEQVEVVFEVNKKWRDRITTESTAVLGSVSLLGQASVDVTPSSKGTPIQDWGYVPTGRPAAQLSDVATQTSQGVQEITQLVQGIRQGRGTVGKLIADDRLYVELQQFVATTNDLAKGIRQGRGTLGKLINDPKAAQSLEASLKNIEEMTRRINAGQGSLGKLLQDDSFATSLQGATESIRMLTDKLNRGEGTAGKLMTDATLFNRLNSVTGRLDELTKRLNDGEGTVGQLLKDRQLYENMNKVVTDISSLITEIRKDPRKYLNVKVSIF